MTSRFFHNPKGPTQDAFSPSAIRWSAQSSVMCEVFQKHLPDIVSLKFSEIKDHGVPKFLLFEDQARRKWFGKLTLEPVQDLAMVEYRVHERLTDLGAPVPNTLRAKLIDFPMANRGSAQKIFLSVSEFIDGSFIRNCIADAKLVGSSLAELHGKLREIEDTDLRLMSESFNRTLLENLSRKEYNYYPSVFDPIITELDRFKESDFELFFEDQQIIHGDLNLGNVIIKNECVYFIDFEDTAKAYLNPLIDIAFLTERAFLNSNTPTKEIIFEFLRHYKDSSHLNLDFSRIPKILELISIRSLLIICLNYEKYHILPNRSEIEKFLCNCNQARNIGSFLKLWSV